MGKIVNDEILDAFKEASEALKKCAFDFGNLVEQFETKRNEFEKLINEDNASHDYEDLPDFLDIDDELDDEIEEETKSDEDIFCVAVDYYEGKGEKYDYYVTDNKVVVTVSYSDENSAYCRQETNTIPEEYDKDNPSCSVDNEYGLLFIKFPKKKVEKKVEKKEKKKYAKYMRPTSTNFLHQKRDELGRFIKGKK